MANKKVSSITIASDTESTISWYRQGFYRGGVLATRWRVISLRPSRSCGLVVAAPAVTGVLATDVPA